MAETFDEQVVPVRPLPGSIATICRDDVGSWVRLIAEANRTLLMHRFASRNYRGLAPDAACSRHAAGTS